MSHFFLVVVPEVALGLVAGVFDFVVAFVVVLFLTIYRVTGPAMRACMSEASSKPAGGSNFDASGRWRDRDRFTGAAIDASGTLPDGTAINGPDDLRQALLRHPEQFAQTFTEGLLKYATGRTLEYRDMPTVRGILREAARDDYRFSTIVRGIVGSEQFLKRRAPQKAPGEKTGAVASR